MDMESIKKELSDLIVNSLVIGLEKGHITEDQFIQLMSEVEDMMNDTPEEIHQLGSMMIHQRQERSRGDPDGS